MNLTYLVAQDVDFGGGKNDGNVVSDTGVKLEGSGLIDEDIKNRLDLGGFAGQVCYCIWVITNEFIEWNF